MGITIYEADLLPAAGYPLASITAGKKWHIPVPELNYGIDEGPILADVGVFMDVEIDGNAAALELMIDVDMCGVIKVPIFGNKTECLSDALATKLWFPIVLLDQTLDFSGICGPAAEKVEAPFIHKPVCCSQCTDNCIWNGVQHECKVGC
jgi:hypothetical protein|tara:strand:+ start:305 stop:754 length:450 start_codon:yes stop_codon:yes gene_type:complete